jgi:hypothetical protein
LVILEQFQHGGSALHVLGMQKAARDSVCLKYVRP